MYYTFLLKDKKQCLVNKTEKNRIVVKAQTSSTFLIFENCTQIFTLYAIHSFLIDTPALQLQYYIISAFITFVWSCHWRTRRSSGTWRTETILTVTWALHESIGAWHGAWWLIRHARIGQDHGRGGRGLVGGGRGLGHGGCGRCGKHTTHTSTLYQHNRTNHQSWYIPYEN